MATKAKKGNTKANKDGQAVKVHWSFWLGVAFFVSVIVGLLSFGTFVTKRMAAEESLPVTSVKVIGDMPYTKRADIDNELEQVNLGNFFNVDVNTIQQRVADLPWVYSVSVRKQWPNQVLIYVVDQTPVAKWNGDFFINKFGVAFQANAERVEHAIPAFYGPEGSEIIALENFDNFSRLLNYSQLSIEELVLTERYSWQITLNDGVKLNLGREESVERIQRFMDAYGQIKATSKQNQQVDYVDLRYDTGLAVGYKSAA